MTEHEKQFMQETTIARLKSGGTRENVRAELEAAGAAMSEKEWKDFLNDAVVEEVRRHNAANHPSLEGYEPRPTDFNLEGKVAITCRDGKWSAEKATPEFLEWERHQLPTPGSKALHCRGGIITSELLPDTWEGVKKWLKKNDKK